MAHALNWFEIPVTDIERAMKFYNTVFDVELQKMDLDYTTMA
ncbi:MAG TPA: VOC family protein, partial [Trueperaceae bacterium]|nr:VOC family protein [Trueperaceae bacterium]